MLVSLDPSILYPPFSIPRSMTCCSPQYYQLIVPRDRIRTIAWPPLDTSAAAHAHQPNMDIRRIAP